MEKKLDCPLWQPLEREFKKWYFTLNLFTINLKQSCSYAYQTSKPNNSPKKSTNIGSCAKSFTPTNFVNLLRIEKQIPYFDGFLVETNLCRVEVWTNNILYGGIEGQTTFSTACQAKMNLPLISPIYNVISSNLHTTSDACTSSLPDMEGVTNNTLPNSLS